MIKLADNEKILHEGKANMFNIFILRSGQLYITNKRIVFEGNGMNMGKEYASVDLSDVLSYTNSLTVTLFRLFIPIPNAIKIVSKKGDNFKFRVYNREKWLKTIATIIAENK
ncbi:MAG: GRAM domain-containing protein [Oscillospiraceae bacterium]